MSDEQMKKLVRKRGSVKATLTNFKNFVENVKAKQVLSDLESIQLRDRLFRAENVIVEFGEVQGEIEALVENLEEQYAERAKFEDEFYAAIAIAKRMLENSDEKSDHDINSQHSSGLETTASSNRKVNTVKLPTIELPKFKGSFHSWLDYRDIYESLIHENDSLTEIQKFHYLRASLEGDAAQVIKSVEFTAASYGVAWRTLCERYNNTKLLVYNHVKALFSLECMQKETSSKIRKLIDDISKHLRSLEQLGQKIENWDTLLIFLVNSKLDSQTVREWEKHIASLSDLPTVDDFKVFLKGRADLLETLEFKGTEKQYAKQRDIKQGSRSLLATGYVCYYCKKDHSIYGCEEFKKLSVHDRSEFVKGAKLCINCLREGHTVKKCKIGPCKKCRAWHNSLLHEIKQDSDNKGDSSEVSNALSGSVVYPGAGHVFLSTAYIQIVGHNGRHHRARALLDCGSQSSFISSKMRERLGIQEEKANLCVFGISNAESRIRYKCEIKMHSLYSTFSAQLTCFVLREITNVLPSCHVNISSLDIPSQIILADPEFFKPGPIDILIGADLFWNLLCSGRISCGKNKPILQETQLGWVVSGQIGSLPANNITCNLSTNLDLHRILARFWEIEECDTTKPLSKEESTCETIFKETTSRGTDGRFIVSLPIKQSAECLGESKSQAESRFYSLERKLLKNEILRKRYVEFMKEYETLNHMTIAHDSVTDGVEYYMPHHGVLREESLTTKLRVVFDASAPSSSGMSLNNIQLVGPVVQDDLLSILLRFRKHAYVISADIAKMYRQVLVSPGERNLQKIVWRADPSDPIRNYTLNTVTYGQASASFLAIRCLFELANECEEMCPDIANIIRRDFYVDDLLSGADTLEQASRICREVSRILKSGCFELRKWHANKFEALEGIADANLSRDILDFSPDQGTKTSGLTWFCEADQLAYSIENMLKEKQCTKRSVLSLIARIFDPLGLLSPSTIIAKITMQKLWAEKIAWDSALPPHIFETWTRYKNDLGSLADLRIPRRVVCERAIEIELHGFSDASEQAYGASIYVRSVDAKGNVFINLLCAKSKVAPIKALTIPRLELCAALLLARLVDKVVKSIDVSFDHCILWSDSTIALAWINTSSNLLKPFIANRVSEIQSLTKAGEWKYVPTHDNPADLVTRGLYPSQIIISNLWWSGPPWLKLDPSEWPALQYKVDSLPELKVQSVALPGIIQEGFPFQLFSKFLLLQGATACIIRFKYNCLNPASQRKYGHITVHEVDYALKCLVKASQRESFPDVVSDLLKGQPVHAKNKISSLTPFLDEDQIIRVGGRLKNSDYSFEKKHPILLHAGHTLTKLLFRHEHKRLLHAGPQLLLASIRERFWPISGRNLARITVRKCMKCFRFKPETVQPVMGNLPRERATPSSPFEVSGVDFAGPFSVRDRRGRGSKLEKCYVSVFICFSTKAMHLELVSSLSTNAFLLALRRFIARRGKPSKLFSDNGTNFVGAQRELGKFIASNKDSLESVGVNEQIEWQFLPPYSPHFGGLWEAGVKSFKHHLRRVVANSSLTFEEFTTVLTQIEAVLNSRPLCPLSADPNDLRPLSPAHFLIGRSLVTAPDRDVTDIPTNRLTRYQLIQQICQHFWQRWGKEYISELQQRTRWKNNKGQLTEGALVLIKDDQLLPTEWKMGRIVQLHKGSDGVTRVASINTRNGVIKRNFQKICPLPLED